jgi:hypothetical protein
LLGLGAGAHTRNGRNGLSAGPFLQGVEEGSYIRRGNLAGSQRSPESFESRFDLGVERAELRFSVPKFDDDLARDAFFRDSAVSSGQLEVDFASDQIDDRHEIAQ